MTTLQTIQKSYIYFLAILATCIFILLHTNQNSSQTLATFLFAFSPFLLLFSPPEAQNTSYKLIVFSVVAYITYFFLQYFQRENSDIAYGAARNLLFLSLLPATIILAIKIKPSKQHVFYLLFATSLLSTSPIFSDLLNHSQRGNSAIHPIFWGNMALCTGFMCFAFGQDLTKRESYLSYIALFFSLAASFWSGTRGGWITIPFIMLFLVYTKIFNFKKIILIFLLISTAIAIHPNSRNRIVNTFTILQPASINDEEKDNRVISVDNATNERLAMWQIAYTAFLKSPLIGNGLDGFYKAKEAALEQHQTMEQTRTYKHSHNDILEILSSGGVLGLLFYLIVFASLLRIYITKRKQPNLRPYANTGILLCIEFILFGLTETFMLSKLTVVYFSLINGLLIGSIFMADTREINNA